MTGRAVFFWLFICTTTVFPDPVAFNVDVTCKQGMHWCGKVFIYELDHNYTHDKWFESSFCTSALHHIYSYEPHNGGGDLSRQYEIGFQLTHNCTMDNKIKCFEQVKDVQVIGATTVDFHYSVFGKGKMGECVHPNVKPL